MIARELANRCSPLADLLPDLPLCTNLHAASSPENEEIYCSRGIVSVRVDTSSPQLKLIAPSPHPATQPPSHPTTHPPPDSPASVPSSSRTKRRVNGRAFPHAPLLHWIHLRPTRFNDVPPLPAVTCCNEFPTPPTAQCVAVAIQGLRPGGGKKP